jgi:endogenous inhibitor of DNA gyrase (YacG/DUF329 family)
MVMGIPFPHPRYLPCSECGTAVERSKQGEHECSPECRLDYQMFQLREELAALDREMEHYLHSAQGRFELWYAERDRSSGTGRET